MEGAALIVLIIALFVVAYVFVEIFVWAAWIGALVILLGLFYAFFVKKYDETERAIIYRMGRFNRIAGPGWSIVVPFFEKEFQKLDVRTKILPLQVDNAFTSEDLSIMLNGSVYYKVKDPEKAVLKIENYISGLKDMIISETRNVIASMSLTHLFANLDDLNELLADEIRHSTWNWGIDVDMVQIKYIQPSTEIIDAMKKKTIASQELQANKFRAQSRKVLIEAIGEAAKSLDDRAATYLYLKALEKIGQSSSTKMVIPSNLDNIGKGLGFGAGMSMGGMQTEEVINSIKDRILESK